jgi:hypothetical protein
MASRRPTADSPRSTDPAAAVKKAPRRRGPPRVKAKEAPVASDVLVAPSLEISPELRRTMIAEAAYWRAERRGFEPGHEMEDWFAAEAEVDALLKDGQSTTAQ